MADINPDPRWDNIVDLSADLVIVSSDINAVELDRRYDIADGTARLGVFDNRVRIDKLSGDADVISAEVAKLGSIVAGGVSYRGKTGQTIEDGLTSTTITMADETTLTVVAGKGGDMVIVPGTLTGKEDREYIWDGEKWNEFGNASQLKSFAFADEGIVNVKPGGTVSISSTTAQSVDVTATFTATNSVNVVSGYAPDDYTPEGSVVVDAFTPAGTISCAEISIGVEDITVQQVGEAVFSGTEITVMTGYTPAAYTPSGAISVGAIEIGDKSVTVTEVTSATFSGNTIENVMTGYTPAAYTPEGQVSCAAIDIGDKSVTVKEVVSAEFTGSEVTPTGTFTGETAQTTFTGKLTELPVLSANDVDYVTEVSSESTVAGNAYVEQNVLKFNFNTVVSSMGAAKQHVNVAYSSQTTEIGPIGISATGTALTGGSVVIDAFTPAGGVAVELSSVEKTVAIGSYTPEAVFNGTAKAPTGTENKTDFTAAGEIALSSTNVAKTVAIGTIAAGQVKADFIGETTNPTGQVLTTTYAPSGDIEISKTDVTIPISTGKVTPTAVFTGTEASVTAQFNGTAKAPTGTVLSGTYSPTGDIAGSVEIPAHTHDALFTGTSADWMVYPFISPVEG